MRWRAPPDTSGMRASSNRLAVGPDGVRASDAERDEAIDELRDRFAEGRLSQDTFLMRVDAALRAKDRAELSGLFADLPGSRHRSEHRQDGQHQPGQREFGQPEHGQPEPGQPESGRRGTGRPGIRRLARERLARLRWAAARRLGMTMQPAEPEQLRLPPHTGSTFTIGRELACDFTLGHLSVSRWHARLHREADGWMLSDLGSTNGTRLNGWRVTTDVPVRPGDRVSFGGITFVIADRPIDAG